MAKKTPDVESQTDAAEPVGIDPADPLNRTVTWADQPFKMRNKFGEWTQGEPRTGFTEEQAAELEATPGFVVDPPTSLAHSEPEPAPEAKPDTTPPAPEAASAPEAAPASDGTQNTEGAN